MQTEDIYIKKGRKHPRCFCLRKKISGSLESESLPVGRRETTQTSLKSLLNYWRFFEQNMAEKRSQGKRGGNAAR